MSTMKFAQATNSGRYTIHSYSAGEIHVLRTDDSGIDPTHETLTLSLILTPTQLIRNWPPRQFDELVSGHFDFFDQLRPEVVLLGCGARQRFFTTELQLQLAQRGISAELMNTGAACRTFNILAGDGRNVAAALLMI